MSGMIQKSPGPRSPSYCPRRNTTARSHCRAMRGDSMRIKPTTIPMMMPCGLFWAALTARPAPIDTSRTSAATMLNRAFTCGVCCFGRAARAFAFLGMSGLLLGGARRLEPLEVLHDFGERDADRRRVSQQTVDEWPQLPLAF